MTYGRNILIAIFLLIYLTGDILRANAGSRISGIDE